MAVDGNLVPATIACSSDGLVVAINQHDSNARHGLGNVQAESFVDLGDCSVFPAPLDLHFHGCGGVGVAPDGDVAALEAAHTDLSKRAARWSYDLPVGNVCIQGTPGYLATLPIPGTDAEHIVAHVASAARQLAATSTQCEGLRLEGCFINPDQAGVWPAHGLIACDIGVMTEIVDAAADAGMPVKVIDVAPELDGAIELIEAARARGIVVAMAHTCANHSQALRGCDAGITLATHLFNAMTGIHHRAPGAAGAAIDDDRVTIELICDAVHVHPAIARIAVRASGMHRTCFVSDASPFAGTAAGTYVWNGMHITCDGATLRNANGDLAGSHVVLAHAASEHALGSHMSDVSIAAMCSIVPRMVIDPQRPFGLAVGDRIWLPHDDLVGARADGSIR